MRRVRRLTCPTPRKFAARSMGGLKLHARHWARQINERGEVWSTFYGYLCRCDRWHLTHHDKFRGKPVAVILYAPSEDVQRWAMGGPTP